MAAVASTSTPQSMVRTGLDPISTSTSSMTSKREQEYKLEEEEDWTPLSPRDSSQQAKRIMLPPIRTLLNEQLATREPPPSSASSTSSNTMRLRRLQTAASSPLDDRFENQLPSPASSQHFHPNHHSRRPIIPSHSSASPLMDMHDCILNKQLRRERRRDHRLPHSSSNSTSSSPYDLGRRPSLSSSSHSSSYLDSNSEVLPSPTTTSVDFSSQRAASWVSQFSLSMTMNGNNNSSSPLASPISSTSSSNYIFPGPLDTRRLAHRHDTNETIKESDCSPVYSTSSSTTSPGPVTPQSAWLQKKPSCALAAKRLWELPLCISK